MLGTLRRYTTKGAWQGHLQGDAFKAFSSWFAESGIQGERLLECYDETTVGFMER